MTPWFIFRAAIIFLAVSSNLTLAFMATSTYRKIETDFIVKYRTNALLKAQASMTQHERSQGG
jgi:hypothetical protein